MPPDATLLGYEDKTEWARAGSETYLCRGFARYQHNDHKCTVHFVVKALVGMFPLEQEKNWARRRKLLQSLGIPVSHWFCHFDALILEPYYEYGEESFVQLGLVEDLGPIGAILDRNGFVTLNFIADLRSDGVSLYYTDFGSDLGEPGTHPCDHARRELGRFCARHGIRVPESYNSRLMRPSGGRLVDEH
jgi:hypothetical protein